MSLKASWIVATAVTLGMGLAVTRVALVSGFMQAASAVGQSEAAEIVALQQSETEIAAARQKDPQWKPQCAEVGSIQVGEPAAPGALKNFCLSPEGNILACYAPASEAAGGPAIRVYSPAGALLNTFRLPIRPLAIGVAKDGTIFVGGDGRLLKLDSTGKELASAASPVASEPVVMTEELKDMLKENIRDSGQSLAEEIGRMQASLEARRSDVTGLAVTDTDVFMAVPAPNDFTSRVYRFDHDLRNPKQVVDKLRGCCGQMDIQAAAGNLWISHNARHRVECRDREGQEISKFGKAGRVKASDFGGCCEPKNVRVLPNGDVLAAESGPPTCIKRFSAKGEFLGVVAVYQENNDCVRVTVDVSPDGSRFYLLDTKTDSIRIFGAKS